MKPLIVDAGNRNQMGGDRNARHHRSTSNRPRWSAGALPLTCISGSVSGSPSGLSLMSDGQLRRNFKPMGKATSRGMTPKASQPSFQPY